QTYKHLDQFTSDTYFPAFIEGNGAVKDTVINHLGLRVDYKFDAGDHASFTILRNYDIAPQDCSFMPDRFTITVKGGNKDDQIRIRLWEDLNLNRKFDSTDEVYASRYYPLGDSAWNTLQFPITSFKKVTGQGNNKLYLNRIRAWDIEVTSQIPSMHTGELFVNDLRFYSNYKPAS